MANLKYVVISTITLTLLIYGAQIIKKHYFVHEFEIINLNDSKSRLKDSLLEYVNTTNQQLPVMIDKQTRVDQVFCVENNIIIKYTLVNLDLLKADKQILQKFKENADVIIVKNFCKIEENKKLIELGVGYYLRYFDKNGKFITEIYLNNNICTENKVEKEKLKDNSQSYVADYPKQPEQYAINTEFGTVKAFSCNEKIADSNIMYSITEYPKYNQSNRKLAEMTIEGYMKTLKNIKVLKKINWNNYSQYEDRASYEFSYNFENVNATEKGFMTIYKDNMVRVSFTYIGNNVETINKGNNFLKSFKFVE